MYRWLILNCKQDWTIKKGVAAESHNVPEKSEAFIKIEVVGTTNSGSDTATSEISTLQLISGGLI